MSFTKQLFEQIQQEENQHQQDFLDDDYQYRQFLAQVEIRAEMENVNQVRETTNSNPF